MDICIIKSASRETYFSQNLKLLYMHDGEEMALKYRTRWYEPSLLDKGSLAPASATIVYCDQPTFQCIPIRQFEIYKTNTSEDAIVLYGRCGPFVDPEKSAEWAHEFRNRHPNAGNTKGYYIAPLNELGLCPLASNEHQIGGWRDIVAQLAKEEKYCKSFFFYNKGITDDNNNEVSPKALRTGSKYTLTVMSYNRHFSSTIIQNAQLRLITDDNILEAITDTEKIPAYKDINISLEPLAEGNTRVELCVSGDNIPSSRLKIDVEVIAHGKAISDVHALSGSKKTSSAMVVNAKWQVFKAFIKAKTSDTSTLLKIINECFTREETLIPDILEEKIALLFSADNHKDIVDFLPEISADIIKKLSEDTRERLLLSYFKINHKLPPTNELWNVQLYEKERWGRFKSLVLQMPPSHSSALLLSIIEKFRDLMVDEENLIELLCNPNVITGFNVLSRVRSVFEWLLNEASHDTSYRFIINRISELNLTDIDILTKTLALCESCQQNLENIAALLIIRLLETGKINEAYALINKHVEALSSDIRPALLENIADKLSDPTIALWAYQYAAREYRSLSYLLEATHTLTKALVLCKNHKLEEANLIQKEMEEIQMLLAETPIGATNTIIDQYIERARNNHSGKIIAVIGGEVTPSWKEDVEKELNTTIIWFPVLPGHMHGNTSKESLKRGIENNKYSAVIQLRWGGHSTDIAETCKAKNIPFKFMFSGGKLSVIRSLADT